MSRWLPFLLAVACGPKQTPTTDAAPPPEQPVLHLDAPMHDSATAVQMHDWLQLAEWSTLFYSS